MTLTPPIPRFLSLLILLALPRLTMAAESEWRPLFNGKDLTGWETYLHKPQPMWEVPGMQRDEKGNYSEEIGVNRDPLKVYTVVPLEDRPTIRISGQGYGVMQTNESFANYHLRLQMKWGEKRWEPRLKVRRDSGILYHCHGPHAAIGKYWPRSAELQIQENDFGDLYAVGMQISVRVRRSNTEKRPQFTYDPAGELTAFELNTPNGNRAIRSENLEKPHGEWNTLEVICLGEDSVHIVNGKVVMRLTKSRRLDGAQSVPLTEGKIALQAECAEVFYRDVEIRPIKEMPAEFAEKK